MSSLRHKASTGSATERTGSATERRARDAYLDAARETILDVGWKRSTLTEVARRAGVSRMTIYRNWPDMERLFSDLMTREWGTLVAGVVDFDTDGPWVDRLVDGICATIAAVRLNPLFRRILDVDPDLLLPYLLARRGRSQDGVIAVLVERLTLAQQAGEVRSGDPLLIARSLVLLAHGFVLSVDTMADDGITVDDLDEELRLTLHRALQP